MKISVLGLGYIGLPTALLLAQAHHDVHGFDVDVKKIATLQSGQLPFNENGLPELFQAVQKRGNFIADNSLQVSDVYIIAVPTPHIGKEADLKYVYSALDMVSLVLKDNDLVIIESTIPPLTCSKDIWPCIQKTGKKVFLAHCPERAIPGNTLVEMQNNERVVGGIDAESAKMTAKLYEGFVNSKVHITDCTTAECCKVMENTYRDVNIALANEFTKIAEEIDLNVWEAISLANLHPRVNIHAPGPGVGGHCIPIDPWFLVSLSKHSKLIEQARGINDGMPEYVVKQFLGYAAKHNIVEKKVGVLGVSYKKNVDDARETPSERIIDLLEKAGWQCYPHDPFVRQFKKKLYTLEEIIPQAEALLIVTDHDQYKDLSLQSTSAVKMIYDSRNCLIKANFQVPIYRLGVKNEDSSRN